MFGNSLLYFFLTFNLFGSTRLFPISSDHIQCELQFVTETSQFLGSLWPSKMPWRKSQTVRLCPQVQNLQNQHENFPNSVQINPPNQAAQLRCLCGLDSTPPSSGAHETMQKCSLNTRLKSIHILVHSCMHNIFNFFFIYCSLCPLKTAWTLM